MGTPSYEGKQVYMGLDVHREFFVASCICDGVELYLGATLVQGYSDLYLATLVQGYYLGAGLL